MSTPTTAAGTAKPVALVSSASAGRAEDRANVASALAEAGLRVVEQHDVAELDARRPLGERWQRAGLYAVVAAGGDGTLGNVATHLATCTLPLGILPAGTSNDVARSLGVPLDLAEAARAIASGVVAYMDLGQAEPAVTEPGALAVGPFRRLAHGIFRSRSVAERAALERAGVCFLHAATLGLNVEFARLATDVARRERWGALNYASAAIESLAHMQPIPVRLDLRDVHARSAFEGAPTRPEEAMTVECSVVQLAVVNTRIFGGGLNLAMPGVYPRDQLLDVLIIEALEPRHLRETVESLLGALGRLKDRLASGDAESAPLPADDSSAGLLLPGVRRYQVRSVRIATQQPLDVTLDGEIRGRTPIQIRVAPHQLRVLLPEAAATALAARGGELP